MTRCSVTATLRAGTASASGRDRARSRRSGPYRPIRTGCPELEPLYARALAGASTQMSNVLITGTSSGFGFLIAKTLVGAGHRVFAGVRDMGGKGAQALKDVAASSDGKLTIISL